jgi:predicted RNase H-like nuclease (RuvC/YqgF family)
MLWLRLSLVGAIVIAIVAAIHQFTSYMAGKDVEIQKRALEIEMLNARVTGLQQDAQALKDSNANLDKALREKVEEAARARAEANTLNAVDRSSNKRQNELEARLADRDRLARFERLSHSGHAEMVVQVVNASADCELKNFFRTDGKCANGVWKPQSVEADPNTTAARTAAAEGASSAPR